MDEFNTVATEAPAEFQAAEPEETEEGFPSFRYGPDGQSMVCHSKAEVPSGWVDHPSKVKGAPDPSLDVSEKRQSRAVFVKALKDLGVKFSPAASAKQLEQLLADEQERRESPGSELSPEAVDKIVKAENKKRMAAVRAQRKPKAKAPAKPKTPSKAARSGKK